MTNEEITTAKRQIHEEAKVKIASMEKMSHEDKKAAYGTFEGFLAAKEEVLTDARIAIKNLK